LKSKEGRAGEMIWISRSHTEISSKDSMECIPVVPGGQYYAL
jgi:hypothetical protein